MTRWHVRQAWSQLMRFTGRALWERDLDDLGIAGRAIVTLLRIATVVCRGFSRHQLTTRAGALTYVTMFSLVPTLAVAFAMFSAFGGLTYARDMLLERVMAYLAVGVRVEVTQGIDRVLGNINSGAVGAAGLVFVIIAVFTLLSSIEDVFNDIWGVKRTRGYLDRLTLYWTAVTVSPTLIVLGMSLPALLRRVVPLRWLLERTGTVDAFFGIVVPWSFVVVAFTALYALIISRRIPVVAALVGGIAGGTLWFGGAHAYGWYAASTVYYANVYGSLAAIPIFIFWLYLSWLIVFIGAQVAFAWQNLDRYREEILSVAPSQNSRERITLAILGQVTRRLVSDQPPASGAELAATLRLSARAVNEALGHLVALGWLMEVGAEPRLVLVRDPRQFSPVDVIHGLRSEGQEVVACEEDPLTQRIRALYDHASDAADAAWNDRSFADLAEDEPTSAVPHTRGEARHAKRR